MTQPQQTGHLHMNILQLCAPFTSSVRDLDTTREVVQAEISRYIKDGYTSHCHYALNGDISILLIGSYSFDKSTPAVRIRIVGNFRAGATKRVGREFLTRPDIKIERRNYTETWVR